MALAALALLRNSGTRSVAAGPSVKADASSKIRARIGGRPVQMKMRPMAEKAQLSASHQGSMRQARPTATGMARARA